MTVEFEEITTGCIHGDGVFDQLMKATKAHLKEEYDAQRIRGSEYSQVYLGSLQSAMSQSIQWQLGAEIAKNQALLIEKQIEGQEKQNLLLEEQRALIIAQTAQVEAQTAMTQQQTINLATELDNMVKQGIILDTQGAQAVYTLDELMPAQLAKTETETNILNQKLITEEAQTKDTTTQGAVTGLIGKQKELYGKQADGFDRDAEQKATRLITDTWGIAVSSDLDGDAVPSEVSKSKIDEVVRHIRQGADISGDSP